MKIGKEFKWEMSHRLPFHDGPCKNVHGHSYKMRVIVEGVQTDNSMIIDYYDLDVIFRPIIMKLDHTFLCDAGDALVIDFLKANGFKLTIMPNYTTAENITEFILNEVAPEFKRFPNATELTIRVYETEDAYAERTMLL